MKQGYLLAIGFYILCLLTVLLCGCEDGSSNLSSTYSTFGLNSTREEVKVALGMPNTLTQETETNYETWGYIDPETRFESSVYFEQGQVRAWNSVDRKYLK